MDKYAALEAAAMAATPGPWVADENWNGEGSSIVDSRGEVVADDGSARGEYGERLNAHNAAYIAAANPAVILALLADLRMLQQRNLELTRETAAATAARRMGPRPPSKPWTDEMRAEHRKRKRLDAELAKMYEARAEGVKR